MNPAFFEGIDKIINIATVLSVNNKMSMTHLTSNTYSKSLLSQFWFQTLHGYFYFKMFFAIVTSLCFMGESPQKACTVALNIIYILPNSPQKEERCTS